jgi:hypothetical protein
MVWQVICQALGVVMDYVPHSNLHFPTAVAYITVKKSVQNRECFTLRIPVQVYGLTTCLKMKGHISTCYTSTFIFKSSHNPKNNLEINSDMKSA